jgi:hypothetical protein
MLGQNKSPSSWAQNSQRMPPVVKQLVNNTPQHLPTKNACDAAVRFGRQQLLNPEEAHSVSTSVGFDFMPGYPGGASSHLSGGLSSFLW